MAAHDEAAGDIVKNLAHLLAELAHLLAAIRAGAVGRIDNLFAWQTRRQGISLRLAFRFCSCLRRRRNEFGFRRLQILDQSSS